MHTLFCRADIKSGILFLLLTIFFSSVRIIFAGGGAIKPINFAVSEQISAKSFTPEVAVMDPNSGYSSPLVGKPYRIEARGEAAGASCETTQGTTDSNGRIKASCKADSYGKLVFAIINGETQSAEAVFDVYFVESKSSSGFNEGEKTGSISVSISPSSVTNITGSSFRLEAKLKRDGQPSTDYNGINFFRWEPLQGSFVMDSTGEKQSSVSLRTYDIGKTVIRVSAVMDDGRLIESGAITVNTIVKPVPTPKPVVVSEKTETVSPSPTAPVAQTVVKKVPIATASTAATESTAAGQTKDAEVQQQLDQLQQQVEEQQQQLNVLQKIVKSLNDAFKNVFGRWMK